MDCATPRCVIMLVVAAPFLLIAYGSSRYPVRHTRWQVPHLMASSFNSEQTDAEPTSLLDMRQVLQDAEEELRVEVEVSIHSHPCAPTPLQSITRATAQQPCYSTVCGW